MLPVIDRDTAEDLVAAHGSPLYVAHTGFLEAELDRLRQCLTEEYPRSQVAYSVKTNYLPRFVLAAHEGGHLIEVVSRHELEFVRRLGVPPEHVVFNGPGKTPDDLRIAFDSGLVVNLDSTAEVAAAIDIASGLGRPVKVGLRIAATLASGERSRFGLVPELVTDLVGKAIAGGSLQVVGLHIHHSTRRDADSYGDRVRQLATAARSLGLSDLEFVDIGGGLASQLPLRVRDQLGYDVSAFEDYASVIGAEMRDQWRPDAPALWIEAGTVVLAGAMSYLTRVVSTRPEDGLAVVDGTLFEINPLRSRVNPPADLLAERPSGLTRLYGSTCMEIDVLGDIDAIPEVGDLIAITNVGAYTMSLSPDFIVPRAEIVEDSGDVLRQRQTVGTLGAVL